MTEPVRPLCSAGCRLHAAQAPLCRLQECLQHRTQEREAAASYLARRYDPGPSSSSPPRGLWAPLALALTHQAPHILPPPPGPGRPSGTLLPAATSHGLPQQVLPPHTARRLQTLAGVNRALSPRSPEGFQSLPASPSPAPSHLPGLGLAARRQRPFKIPEGTPPPKRGASWVTEGVCGRLLGPVQ